MRDHLNPSISAVEAPEGGREVEGAEERATANGRSSQQWLEDERGHSVRLLSEAVIKWGAFLFTESRDRQMVKGQVSVTVGEMSKFVVGILERVVICRDASETLGWKEGHINVR